MRSTPGVPARACSLAAPAIERAGLGRIRAEADAERDADPDAERLSGEASSDVPAPAAIGVPSCDRSSSPPAPEPAAEYDVARDKLCTSSRAGDLDEAGGLPAEGLSAMAAGAGERGSPTCGSSPCAIDGAPKDFGMGAPTAGTFGQTVRSTCRGGAKCGHGCSGT